MTFALAMLQLAYTSLMVVFSGYAYSCIWNWFVVTTFHAPIVNIPTAIGLALFITMFSKVKPQDAEHENFQVFSNTVSFFRPATVLLVGYVAKQFM